MLDAGDAGKLRDMVDDFVEYVEDNKLGTTSCRNGSTGNEGHSAPTDSK
jgi:hypothetical protein